MEVGNVKERDGEKKLQLTQRAPRKSLFGAARETRRFSLASRYTQGGHYNVCTLVRAHTAMSTTHMHNSGATNASSHVEERNIKKRAEHKATKGRRGEDEGGTEGGREGERETRGPKERARSEGRREKRCRHKRRGWQREGRKAAWETDREKEKDRRALMR